MLIDHYNKVRQQSLRLAEPLSDEDCGAQSMPDASPVKWHLAHTTWFFETFILESMEAAFAPFHPAFRVLFNSYYNGVGEKHPRAQRGLLTRPGMAQVRAYRIDVDARIGRLLAGELARDERERLTMLLALGLEHEQQHQELLLTESSTCWRRAPCFPLTSLPPTSILLAWTACLRQRKNTHSPPPGSRLTVAWRRSATWAMVFASTMNCRAIRNTWRRSNWPARW